MNELHDELCKDFQDKEYAHTYAEEFLNAEIATQIKALREQQKLSQEELAELTGMKQTRISILENVNYGSFSINTLKRFARAFDLALRVRFESFGTRIDDITNFNRKALERVRRTEELGKTADTVSAQQKTVIDMMKWAEGRNKLPRPEIGSIPEQRQPEQPKTVRGAESAI